MFAALYAAAARRRREWYAARPHARRRLRRPVVSVGNIAVGGRGKTPLAATVARELLAAGERPAILTRGYRRTIQEEGVVVVRDADGIRADLARSGDEPLMLARQLPGCIVMTSHDRYLGGRLAEHRFGATVHVLDDGFQHFQLDRDVDIVAVAREDLDGTTLPSGRLREPPDVLIAADAIVALDAIEPIHPHIAFFQGVRTTRPAVFSRPDVVPQSVFAIAGIARPSDFFSEIARHVRSVSGTHSFRDHHPYSSADVAEVVAQARAAGADAVVTTEKDYVRLLPYRPFPLPIGFVPLTMEVEPSDGFRRWLITSIAAARDIVLA